MQYDAYIYLLYAILVIVMLECMYIYVVKKISNKQYAIPVGTSAMH